MKFSHRITLIVAAVLMMVIAAGCTAPKGTDQTQSNPVQPAQAKDNVSAADDRQQYASQEKYESTETTPIQDIVPDEITSTKPDPAKGDETPEPLSTNEVDAADRQALIDEMSSMIDALDGMFGDLDDDTFKDID